MKEFLWAKSVRLITLRNHCLISQKKSIFRMKIWHGRKNNPKSRKYVMKRFLKRRFMPNVSPLAKKAKVDILGDILSDFLKNAWKIIIAFIFY